MLTKEEIKQALYINLKNNDWDSNSDFVINKEEAKIILELLSSDYNERFNEIHG